MEVACFYVEALDPLRRYVRSLVFLARHASHDEVGKVLSGRSEIALNEAGHAQAAALAARLRDVPLAAIHTSPRRRAMATAEAVAAPHGLAIRQVDALDEIDFGTWAGQDFAALHGDPEWRRWNAARGTAATPAGETMAAVAGRAVRHIEAEAGAGPLLCVSHCDVIRAVAAYYLGLDGDRLLAFDCDPASLTLLAFEDGAGRVVTLNERPA